MRLPLFIFFIFISYFLSAQDSLHIVDVLPVDSNQHPIDTSGRKIHDLWSHNPQSPLHAALFSAVLPGLGQAYNKKYWKIPIVYTGLAVAGYFIFSNAQFYSELKNEYLIKTDNDSTTIGKYDYLSADELLQYADQWKRYTDLSVIIASAVYLLNIIDAIVDAHLYNFDISDDLSMHIDPYFMPRTTLMNNTNNYAAGISFKFSLK